MEGEERLGFSDETKLGISPEREHLEYLVAILDIVLQAGFRLMLYKFSFDCRIAEFLEQLVWKDRLEQSGKHTDSAQNLFELELIRSLGLVNIFAALVEHFTGKTSPLYEVLQNTGFMNTRRQGEIQLIPG